MVGHRARDRRELRPWRVDRDRPATLAEDDLARSARRDAVAVHRADLTAAVVLDANPPPSTQLAGTWHLGVPRHQARDLASALAAVGATARLAWVPGQASAPVAALRPAAGAPRAAQRDATVAALRRGEAPASGAPTGGLFMPWRIDLR